MAELFDVLKLPDFTPSGTVKPAIDAINDTDWLGAINVWLYARTPEPAMIYQLRDFNAVWMPGKLDVAAGGHYSAGETGLDGLREMHEELGIEIPLDQVHYLGRKINVAIDGKQRERRWVIEMYDAEFTGSLHDITLQKEEVEGIFAVPLLPLIDILSDKRESIEVEGLDKHKQPMKFTVTKDSVPWNFDNYHLKMAQFCALKLGISDAYLRD